MSAPRLLTYRALGIGDLLTALPALRALRATYPEHRHVLAAPAFLQPLIAMTGVVDEHLVAEELAPLRRLERPPAVAVNLHGRGPQSHRILLALDPQELIAFAHPTEWADASAPSWEKEEHEVARWCRLLRAHGITVPADPRLHLDVPDGPVPAGAHGATLLHPGAKSAARRWPADRFAEVARAERQAGRRVIVTGSAAERGLADEVARRAGLPGSHVLAGVLDLAGLARVVAAAGRVVCGDTGVAHLATAVGTPSVVIFGPTPPSQWGPPSGRRDQHRVLWAGQRGDPLADEVHPGLLAITTDDVLRELDALDAARVPVHASS